MVTISSQNTVFSVKLSNPSQNPKKKELYYTDDSGNLLYTFM